MSRILDIETEKKKYQIGFFSKNNLDQFNANEMYLHCVKKTLYDIKRESESELTDNRFWFETDVLDLKYSYSENVYRENSEEGYISVNLDESTKQVVESIENRVIEIFEQQYCNQIIGSVILTFDSIKKMFKSGIFFDTSMKLNIHKKHCCVFLNDELEETQDFNFSDITYRYQVQLVIEPQFVWVMNNNIGLRWNIKQIRLHDTTIPENQESTIELDFDNVETDTNANTKWTLDADSSGSSGNQKDLKVPNKVKKDNTAWSLNADSSSSEGGVRRSPRIKKKETKSGKDSKAWSLNADSSSESI